jgi:mono/diheme cytochrome c family protein
MIDLHDTIYYVKTSACRQMALLLCSLPIFSVAWAADEAKPPSFEADVLPILKANCLACHSGPTPQAGLDLHAVETALKGGKSGPAITPGKADSSLLVEKVTSKSMPPTPTKLDDEQIARIRLWINKGDFKTAHGAELVTESDVLPIFQMRCVVCHGKRKQEGGLDLRTQASRMKGGNSGPALVPGKPDESLIMKTILSGQMPPPKLLVDFFVRPPTTPEVEKLRRWIAGGALPAPATADDKEDRLVTDKDRSFWSFQPPQRPAIPVVVHADQTRNPIDNFLLQALEQKNLSYSPPAEPITLMRRAYFDLTGLPPSPAEVQEYAADHRPDAYERLIDRLLASPRYGERWGKFWLETAGYSDSEGIIDEDLVRTATWRYRDYVIRAFNSDKPYDQFLREQIAGDELVDYKHAKEITPELIDKLVATGFLRMVPDGTYSPANGSVAERINVIADEVEVISSGVLGLTVGCARCHNHKYDPIPQRDYYRLSAMLQTAYDPYDWVVPTERYLDIGLESERKQVAEANAPTEAEIKRLEHALEDKVKPFREKLISERLAVLPEDVRADLTTAMSVNEDKRTPTQKYLTAKFADSYKVTDEDLDKKFPDLKAQTSGIKAQIESAKKTLKEKPRIRALYEMGGAPSPSFLLRRGEAQMIGEAVEPGVPSVLKTGLTPYKVQPPWPDSSGRRLAFARWLTQPNHPLTARVMVNRIWMHHFGRGIVATSSNFGRIGSPPSHPELLDWLSTEFVRQGWSVKAMQRLIMTSTAYRQSSAFDPVRSEKDPENVLVSRMLTRRLDAEQLYDSLLDVTGQLDDTEFGPPVPVSVQPAGEVVAAGSRKQGWRRSIYTLQRRSTPITMLEVFDLPPMSPNCIQRSYSTVPTQSLELTNSEVVRARARYWAGRLIDEYGNDQPKQIEQIYLRAYARRPTSEEIRLAVADLAELEKQWDIHLKNEKSDAPRAGAVQWAALTDLCQASLGSPEFNYID